MKVNKLIKKLKEARSKLGNVQVELEVQFDTEMYITSDNFNVVEATEFIGKPYIILKDKSLLPNK